MGGPYPGRTDSTRPPGGCVGTFGTVALGVVLPGKVVEVGAGAGVRVRVELIVEAGGLPVRVAVDWAGGDAA